jgi:hypothetical protein
MSYGLRKWPWFLHYANFPGKIWEFFERCEVSHCPYKWWNLGHAQLSDSPKVVVGFCRYNSLH